MNIETFFTPVIYSDRELNWKQRITEICDDYFYLSGKKAQILSVENNKNYYRLISPPDSIGKKLLLGAVKVISYCTLLIPLTMLVGKLWARSNLALELEAQLQQPILSIPRGGIQNGGNSCYFASALQCLGSVLDLLPAPETLSQQESETAAAFQQRKAMATAMHQLLEKCVLRGETVTRAEIQRLIELIPPGLGTIPSVGNGGDAREVMRVLLEIVEKSSIRYAVDGPNGQHFITFPENLETQRVPIFEKSAPENPETFKMLYPILSLDNNPMDLIVLRRNISINSNERREILVPFQLHFDHQDIQVDYELVASGISAPEGGHAFAFVKHQEQWQKCNDSVISTPTSEVAKASIRKNSTLLVYRRSPK